MDLIVEIKVTVLNRVQGGAAGNSTVATDGLRGVTFSCTPAVWIYIGDRQAVKGHKCQTRPPSHKKKIFSLQHFHAQKNSRV